MKKNTLFSGIVSLPQNSLKKLLLSCFAMVAMLSTYAAPISSIASGNWNATTTWSTGTVPGVGDVVTINTGNTVTVNIAAAVCSGVTISGGTLVLQNGVGGLTVDGPWVYNSGTFTPNVQTVTFGTGGSIGGTIATAFYNLTINTTSSTDVVTLLTSGVSVVYSGGGGGILTLTNGIFKIGAGNTLNLGTTNPVTINATGGNFAHAGDGAGDADSDGGTVVIDAGNGSNNPFNLTATSANILQFYNLLFGTTVGNSNNVWQITNPGSVKINNLLRIQDNNWSLGTANPPIYGANSTLTIDNNNQGFSSSSNAMALWTANSGTIGVTPGYPNNLTITNVGTSMGNVGGHNYGWLPTGVLGVYGVFTLGNGGASNAQASFASLTSFTSGGMVINSNSYLNAAPVMTINGSWFRAASATYLPNAGLVNFGNGLATCSTPNTINAASGSETFNNVAIINNANVSLSVPVTVSTLTVTSGILTTTPTNILTVLTASPIGITGGSSTAYINGPVKWNLGAAAGIYNFPVGSGACTPYYLPFTLNKVASSAVTATVQGITPGSGGTVDATLGVLSTTEYWSFATSASLPTGSKISVARPTAVSPSDSIAQSTTATGTYTSIGGTPVANGVNNSRAISTNTSLFFTLGAPPIVSTLAATSITTTSVTLNGAFNTGSSKTTSFNYGTSAPAYGTTVNTLLSPINSTTATLDSQYVTGLTANTVYHYQATDGTDNGSDVTFVTAPNPPIVGAPNTPTVDGFTATWSAPAAMGSAPYTYTIEVSTDPTFATGVTTETGISSGSTSYTFTTLNSGTQYYYRVKAVNATASSAWSATSTPISTLIVPTTPGCTTGTGSASSPGAITSTSILPVIDGNVDSIWTSVPANYITNESVPTQMATTDSSRTWKAMWTTDSLYFLIQITDPTLISQNSGLPNTTTFPGATAGTSANYYDFDGAEITLDPDYSHGGSYDGVNDIQLRFNLGALTVSGQSCGCPTQFSGADFNTVAPLIDYKIIPAPGGYTIEAAIPWGSSPASPGINAASYTTKVAGDSIGVEVQVNDANGTGGRNTQYSWANTSQTPYEDPSTFAKAKLLGAASCPVPPTVVLPTVTNITADGATLGATVTSSGDAATLTSRGTGVTASPDVTGTADALPEGGTAISIYSGPARTDLAPQTQYYFLGYAINANAETGVSNVASFFTLSALPATQPTLFACGANNNLTLSWTPVTFPPTPQATNTGYLILRRQDGTDPTTSGITNRIAATQGALPSGTTLVATLTSGSTITYTDATAVAGTAYNYLLVPYTWDGVTADSTYDYFTAGAPTAAATASSGGVTASVTIDNISSPLTLGTQIDLTGHSTIAGNASWTVSPSAPIADTTSLITTSIPTTPNTYTYTLLVNAGGCVGSAQATVTVINAGCLVIPNAFTPNGDGINDTWIIQSSCYTNLTVDVYNRWGSLMYHSDNYSSATAWDGKYHGEDVPDATYYYVVKATSATSNPIKKGSLTIIR